MELLSLASIIKNSQSQPPATGADDSVRALQQEIAETDRGLIALTLELEQRVDARTMELRAAHTELQRTNGELLQLTLDLENRVAERTDQIFKLNQELEQRVADRTAQLAAANRELEAFSSAISHDLRGPLQRISGFSDLLAEELGNRLTARASRHLDRIQAGIRHMSALVDDLLALSGVGRQPLRLQFTNFELLIRDVLSEFELDIADREIHWNIGLLPAAECDPGLMKQALSNLVSNALKFTRGRNPPIIDIGGGASNDVAIVFVRDNGVGFDMSHAHRLFVPFQRLHEQRDFEGTGIGLSTVRRVVERHGGRIWAHSEKGKGATFHFTIPVRSVLVD